MKVAIIGAGFTGLSAGYYLTKKGADVTIFESSDLPGGLAGGFVEKGWEWPLEQHYHHFFASDSVVTDLASEVGQEVVYKTPQSSTYIEGGVYQLDSPLSLIKFKKLNIFDRLRTGVVIAFLKINPFWKPLERITSYAFLLKTMGRSSWDIIWKPLFEKKFGGYAKEINAAWFWARIKKRSASLGYPEGGFLSLAHKIEAKIIRQNGRIIYNTRVSSIERKNGRLVIIAGGNKLVFDKVICTLPSGLFINITKNLPGEYTDKLNKLKGLGAINLVLSLKDPFLRDGSYWLNINEMLYPFLAIVEHTNFVDKSHYNGENLLYIANYLPKDHKYFHFSENELLNEYYPYLRKINKDFGRSSINKFRIFKAAFAQPIVGKDHSKIVPPLVTPVRGLYLCNIEQVYPWDRGTNYAVELGKIVADLVLKSKHT